MQKLKGLTVVGKVQLQPTTSTAIDKKGSIESLIHKTAKRCFVDKVDLGIKLELSELGVSEEYLHYHRVQFLLNFPVNRENQKKAFLQKQQVQKDVAANVRKFGAAFKR